MGVWSAKPTPLKESKTYGVHRIRLKCFAPTVSLDTNLSWPRTPHVSLPAVYFTPEENSASGCIALRFEKGV